MISLPPLHGEVPQGEHRGGWWLSGRRGKPAPFVGRGGVVGGLVVSGRVSVHFREFGPENLCLGLCLRLKAFRTARVCNM